MTSVFESQMVYFGDGVYRTQHDSALVIFFCLAARRVNLPPTAIASPERQELSLPLTAALIDGSRGYPAPCRGSGPMNHEM